MIDAVEREVFEETGVAAKFKALIAVRQAHGFMFGKSDMFFCCGLVLQDASDIGQQLKACVSLRQWGLGMCHGVGAWDSLIVSSSCCLWLDRAGSGLLLPALA